MPAHKHNVKSDESYTIHNLEHLFEAHANTKIAQWHTSYMRNHFKFAGVQRPLRKKLQAPFCTAWKKLSQDGIQNVLLSLWNSPYRECQYVGVDIACARSWTCDSFLFFQQLIETKGWWDTVDVLAPNVLGKFLKLFPEHIPKVHAWRNHASCWLRRSSIIFQLRYRSSTDWQYLLKTCEMLKNDENEFVRKAVIWAMNEARKCADFT
jgi:3-methyladenine DNA glycosylase AlkD